MAVPAGFQPKVEVVGARELRAALRRAGDDMSDLKATHKAAAQVVASEARRRAPYLTGKLSRTVRPGASKSRGYVMAGNNRHSDGGVPYAGPIHFGWPARHIEAQPFLYDALDDRRAQVIDLYQRRVDDMVNRVGRDTLKL